jgi:dUTP pyrophosphatase
MKSNSSKRGFEVLVKEDSVINYFPKRGTMQSAGYDLISRDKAVIHPGQTVLLRTGVTAFMLPDEWLHLKSRSGLSLKKGIIVGAGVIDADYYPNEIGVVIHNFGNESFEVNTGDRVANAIFSKYLLADKDNADTERTSGFGHTGV